MPGAPRVLPGATEFELVDAASVSDGALLLLRDANGDVELQRFWSASYAVDVLAAPGAWPGVWIQRQSGIGGTMPSSGRRRRRPDTFTGLVG